MPSKWSTNYILLLNWGYKVGLWTFFLERRTDTNIVVYQSRSPIRKFISHGISLTFMLTQTLILLTLRVYDRIKEERHLTETMINFSITCIGIMLLTFHFILFWDHLFFKSFLKNTFLLHVRFGKWLLLFEVISEITYLSN